jgi:putative copper export protein
VNIRISTALLVLLPATAFAHPGHGQTDPDSWVHYLTEPTHVISIAFATMTALAVAIGWRRVIKARTRKA